MTSSRWMTPLTLLLLASACKEPDPSVETNTTASEGTDSSAGDTGTTAEPTAGPTSETEPTSDTEPTTDPNATEPTEGPATDSTVGDPTGEACDGLSIPLIDEAACTALATDYQPRVNMSKDDTWAACVADAGVYPQVDPKVPGSVARVVQYETIADLLWRNGAPTKEDFTPARDAYITAEGLESRVVRREDDHFPAIPMAEWDPQVDSDKQCTVEALWMKYPDRCAGPSKISPMIDAAFTAGQTGEGDLQVHAARINAALDWFLYLSVYKEANTCATVKAVDCDSAWAYYTGGEGIDAGIGIAGQVREASQNTHERIHDGILAVRCWRDLNQMDGMYPLLPDVDAEGKALFEQGWEQLDQALHRGFALLVRDKMIDAVNGACGDESIYLPGVWAYLQVAGPVLQREADERDATQAAVLATLWAAEQPPTALELQAGVAALDAIFDCP